MKRIAARLACCPAFEAVAPDTLRDLLQRHHYHLTSHDSGAIVAFRGDRYERLLVLLSGEVRTEMSSYGGKQYTVAEYTAPCLLAPAILFGEDNRLPVSVIATRPIELLRLPRAAVLTLCRTEEAFLEAYLGDVSTRLGVLADKLRLSRFATIRERLADYLLDQYHQQGSTTLQMPHSRRTQAEILGATRPALSRVLSELAEAGIVNYDRDYVQILALEALAELVDDLE